MTMRAIWISDDRELLLGVSYDDVVELADTIGSEETIDLDLEHGFVEFGQVLSALRLGPAGGKAPTATVTQVGDGGPAAVLLDDALGRWLNEMVAHQDPADIEAVGEPYSFVAASDLVRHTNPEHGGISSAAEAQGRLTDFLVDWLAGGRATNRTMLADEVLMHRSDPVARDVAAPFVELPNNRVAWIAGPGEEANVVTNVLNCQAPYPGVSVLTELPSALCPGTKVSDEILDETMRNAQALVVWAWDAEAHLVVPVTTSGGDTHEPPPA